MGNLKHIELFAGCGGMSLGLEASGFELVMANELSPMAGETFSYNLIDENLKLLSEENKESTKVLWLKSQFDKNDLKSRLRENPFDYFKGKFSDINSKTDLNKKLVIGSINDLLEILEKDKILLEQLRNQDIDLVSGGPPCQSFSLAGRREKENQKNLLPLSFARFAGLVKPKFILLENVKGITSPFTLGDHKYYAWLEVAKAFSLEGYVPICFMLNSKYFGIPQNRPRFILLGIRQDIISKLQSSFKKESSLNILKSSIKFYDLVHDLERNLEAISSKDLPLYDIDKFPEFFDGELMPKIATKKEYFITSEQAINDLIINEDEFLIRDGKSEYVNNLDNIFKHETNVKTINNHQVRNHSFQVKARFRWFQILNSLNGLAPQALKILSGEIEDVEKAKLIFEKIKNKTLLLKDQNGESMMKIKDYNSFIDYIKSIQTKKHSQRAIKANEPAPAQMTIPDDLCHYSEIQLRTLTVREMARFQSFPDWFTFRSKITTGGTQRSFEIPQYTQVGNAVPPLLAFHLGNVVKNLLNKYKDA